jgi:hypothetical protein
LFYFISIITIGAWAVIVIVIQQRKRANDLISLKDQAKSISNYIKLNYDYRI